MIKEKKTKFYVDESKLKDLMSLDKEDLKFIPDYAIPDTIKALLKMKQLQEENTFQSGIHYIVINDLARSTNAAEKLGDKINKERVKEFIRLSVNALTKFNHRSKLLFVREIGDAGLFLFTNFLDIIDWAEAVDNNYRNFNKKCDKERKSKLYHLQSRKVVHLGEVTFSDKKNPLALAVNQTFKIEKYFKGGQLGITERVKEIVSPILKQEKIIFTKLNKIRLVGDTRDSYLWIVEKKK